MKTSTLRLGSLALALMLFVSVSLRAQDIVTLPTPDRQGGITAISGGGDGPPPGTIWAGATPSNAGNKPVLVFIHGYSGSANTWFPEGDNDMYARVYNDGYRSAYVTVHPDQTMWVNGDLFADQLGVITNYFGVNKVVVVAHSKGGLDTDAALIHYGGYQYVDRVVSLGSPHYGSPLADLAQSSWVSWLGAIFGQKNDATYVMQTGYMNYFRSVTDTHPNRPYTSFRTLGGWDWSFFSSLGPSGTYLSSSGYSMSNGGNDGVVPYNFSRRPNSTELYYSGSSRTEYDHYELSEGHAVWSTIKTQLPGTLYRAEEVPTTSTAADYHPTSTVASHTMIVTSQGGPATFTLDRGITGATVEIRTLEENALPKITDGFNRTAELTMVKSNAPTEGMVGNFVSQYTMERPVAGKYIIDMDEPFVALVTVNGGGEATLTGDLNGLRRVYRAGETMNLTLDLRDEAGQPITDAFISATARLTGTLEGNAVAAERMMALNFEATDVAGVYQAAASLPVEGVYNISLDAKSGNFHRSITKSVGVIENTVSEPITAANPFDLKSFPNPFTQQTTIRFALEEDETLNLRILDLTGREVQAMQLSGLGEGIHNLNWDGTTAEGAQLPTGTYFIRLEGNKKAQTERVQIIR